MFWLRCDQLLQGACGLLDAIRPISEHVDGPGRQVGRADALCHDAHPRAALGQPCTRGQPGGAHADHDYVEVKLASHVDRCPTSSVPWKIQSSSRAWRSWSP